MKMPVQFELAFCADTLHISRECDSIILVARPGRDTTYGGRYLPLKGGGEMVTYENLFAYSMVIIGIITLVLAFKSSDK